MRPGGGRKGSLKMGGKGKYLILNSIKQTLTQLWLALKGLVGVPCFLKLKIVLTLLTKHMVFSIENLVWHASISLGLQIQNFFNVQSLYMTFSQNHEYLHPFLNSVTQFGVYSASLFFTCIRTPLVVLLCDALVMHMLTSICFPWVVCSVRKNQAMKRRADSTLDILRQ